MATNAVLERKGFPIAFVTTQGFRDILLLQRHGRARIYDLEYAKPKPVVARADSFEVAERVLADGRIETPLDPEAVAADLIPKLTAGGYQAVAICLLNAYVNPVHERALQGLLSAHLPGLYLALSSDITREFREFERASTTTLSAYVQPVIDRYISRFVTRLEAKGFTGRFSVMQSNGGRLPAQAMCANAVNALLSARRPASWGRRARRPLGLRQPHHPRHGGTSTDVCMVTAGKAQLTQEYSLDGLAIRIPLIDINTSGPAAARSSGSMTAACCGSARSPPVPIRARPAMAAVAGSRP